MSRLIGAKRIENDISRNRYIVRLQNEQGVKCGAVVFTHTHGCSLVIEQKRGQKITAHSMSYPYVASFKERRRLVGLFTAKVRAYCCEKNILISS